MKKKTVFAVLCVTLGLTACSGEMQSVEYQQIGSDEVVTEEAVKNGKDAVISPGVSEESAEESGSVEIMEPEDDREPVIDVDGETEVLDGTAEDNMMVNDDRTNYVPEEDTGVSDMLPEISENTKVMTMEEAEQMNETGHAEQLTKRKSCADGYYGKTQSRSEIVKEKGRVQKDAKLDKNDALRRSNGVPRKRVSRDF